MSDDYLFDVENISVAEAELKFRAIETPLWTKNKARFIARYLKTFTYVTKHGTYLDGFAGPQHDESREESWAAKLVMENEPAWLRNFHLFDQSEEQVGHLNALRASYLGRHDEKPVRTVSVMPGDCNIALPAFLNANPLSDREAAFCLLDQRSTECDWATVKSVADHKRDGDGNKIEIFCFLAQGWIDRAIKSWKNDVEQRCLTWWGKEGVEGFLRLSSHERGVLMADRFKSELGYKYAIPFPIQKYGESGRVMFWMIHASDHERAPVLMMQAYRHIGAGGGLDDPYQQMEMEF